MSTLISSIMILYIRTTNGFKNHSTVEITNNNPYNWVHKIGHDIIESISIGGSEIDKHYSSWINIWQELTELKDNPAKPFKKIDCEIAYEKLKYKPLKNKIKHTHNYKSLNNKFNH